MTRSLRPLGPGLTNVQSQTAISSICGKPRMSFCHPVESQVADRLRYRLGFYRGGPVLMSALAGIDIALWDLKARRLHVPLYQLFGGKVRQRVKVYAWIGGDRPRDVEVAAKERHAQGFRAIKMNATEDVDWLDSPKVLEASVERLKTVKALGMDAGLDFHGRIHKPMSKQLAKALEPHHPLFIEEPLLSEHSEGIKQLSLLTTIPIALGERLYSRWDVKRFLEDASVDVLQPDASIDRDATSTHDLLILISDLALWRYFRTTQDCCNG